MPSERSTKHEGGKEVTTGYSAAKSEKDVETSLATAAKGTTAGKGLGAMAKGTTGLPKRSDFDTQEEWIAAVAQYRRNQNSLKKGME